MSIYGMHTDHDRVECSPSTCGMCPPKHSGKFNEDPVMAVVEDHRELPMDQWVIMKRGVRHHRYRARCACGARSEILSTGGMVHGWRADHLRQVSRSDTMTPMTTHQAKPEPKVAEDRQEHEPCQRGTVGCCIDHNGGRDDNCDTW